MDYSDNSAGVFTETLLPRGKERWSSFGAGLLLECLAAALLILIPMVMPKRLEIAPNQYVTPLEIPVVHPWKPQPRPKPVIAKRVVKEVLKEAVEPVPVVVPKPKIYDPVLRTPIAKIAARRLAAAPTIARVLHDPRISMGSSAIPKLRAPVETGGFGDPHGVPDNGHRDRNPNIALLGAFDMPAGPGVGNGSGGRHGARGVIASAGFGNGVAEGGSGGNRGGSVREGVFSGQQAAPAPRVKQSAPHSAYKPVVIVSVPRPVYTAAGRAHKIEGVVLLQVLFSASGEVRVERVIKGLGYGLDQSAEAAAHKIRFRPATRNGRPTDSRAVARIVFALAY